MIGFLTYVVLAASALQLTLAQENQACTPDYKYTLLPSNDPKKDLKDAWFPKANDKKGVPSRDARVVSLL